ncbi:hypothetical protein TEA_026225 [Camellia sinensis var. sinensis]|uniref:Uncharacterized protein n=1 Tax=Camellia sinensis var. sinensis TaxID=542762 RepID=A0A4S4EM24_CAMSN|nr:hypothetical protein TEA_026225 [Camellia sinensis var. sinensis]
MSPYEDRYVDVKFVDKIAGYVTVTVDKEFQRWRLFCLAFGFVLLLLAPLVSSWVPFYYSSSMAVGVFLVIIILLFQLGAGSFLLHDFSMLVNSILVSFGLSEEFANFEFYWSCDFSLALRSDLQDEIRSGFGPSTPVCR